MKNQKRAALSFQIGLLAGLFLLSRGSPNSPSQVIGFVLSMFCLSMFLIVCFTSAVDYVREYFGNKRAWIYLLVLVFFATGIKTCSWIFQADNSLVLYPANIAWIFLNILTVFFYKQI